MGLGFGKRIGPVGVHVSKRGITSSASVGAGGLYASKHLGTVGRGSKSQANDYDYEPPVAPVKPRKPSLKERLQARNQEIYASWGPPKGPMIYSPGPYDPVNMP